MNNNFVIAAADNYSAQQIRPWCQSLRESGYSDRIIIVLYRHGQDVLDECKRWNIEIYSAINDSFERVITYGNQTHAHNIRFYHFWELMQFLLIEGKRVLITDISDVIFQQNPFLGFDNLSDVLVTSSEGIRYQDEEWGANNLLQGFGPVIYESMKTKIIQNVGILNGGFDIIKNLCLQIYEMTAARSYYPSDQSSYNIILDGRTDWVINKNHKSHWTAQIGTTADPTKSWLWERLVDPRPFIEKGKVYNPSGIQYQLVHQWNRNPELKEYVLKRYV